MTQENRLVAITVSSESQKIFLDGRNIFFHFSQKVTWMKLKFKSKFLRYLTDFPTSKLSGEVTNCPKMSKKRALDSPDIGLSNAHRIMTIRQVEVPYIYCIYIFLDFSSASIYMPKTYSSLAVSFSILYIQVQNHSLISCSSIY